MKNLKPNAVITDRDIKLFEYLFKTKGATMRQIQRDIFNSATDTAVNRRLQKLRKDSLVDRVAISDKRYYGVYHLTTKALKFCYIFEGERTRSQLKSPDFRHEVALVDIRNKLQNLEGYGYYLTENELQSGLYDDEDYEYGSFVDLNSDGFLKITINDGDYYGAIEYERSDKGKARYKRLFKDYYLKDEISFVFYFLSSRSLMNTVLRIDKEARAEAKSKIYCVELSEALNANDYLSLTNSNSGILKIKIQQEEES